MKHFRCLLLTIFLANVLSAQTYVASYGSVANLTSQSGILTNLTEFESFGIKYRGTVAQASAMQWLKNKYFGFGYSASEVVEDPFTYSGSTCKNIVVTKTGTLYPNTYVIICGHYDTVNGPGANDNGSGVSVILEIARLLKNVPTEYSIKFINFAGEEDGLIGSQHYVDNVVNATGMDIRLVINLDQVGGVAGETNNTITCENDQSNPSSNNAASQAMTIQLMNCMELYSDLETEMSFAYGSDYVPFENNGEIITGLYETNESPYPHTANDILANMDPLYVYQVAKGAVGAALHFAVACTTCTLASAEHKPDDVTVSPNPSHGPVNITMGSFSGKACSLTIVDLTGKIVYSKVVEISDEIETLPLLGISGGNYLLVIEDENQKATKSILID